MTWLTSYSKSAPRYRGDWNGHLYFAKLKDDDSGHLASVFRIGLRTNYGMYWVIDVTYCAERLGMCMALEDLECDHEDYDTVKEWIQLLLKDGYVGVIDPEAPYLFRSYYDSEKNVEVTVDPTATRFVFIGDRAADKKRARSDDVDDADQQLPVAKKPKLDDPLLTEVCELLSVVKRKVRLVEAMLKARTRDVK